MSLLKRPFGSQSGMDTSEVKNKKPKPNEVTQAWPTTAYSGSLFSSFSRD